MKFTWPVSVIPLPHTNAQSSSTQSIGKYFIAQIDRTNMNSCYSSIRFPVKTLNTFSVSNPLLRSITGINASNAKLSLHVGWFTCNEIIATVKLSMFFEARDSCNLDLAEREPIFKASIGYWVFEQAFVQKLQNAKHSTKRKANMKKTLSCFQFNRRSAKPINKDAEKSVFRGDSCINETEVDFLHSNDSEKDDVELDKKARISSEDGQRGWSGQYTKPL